MRNPQNTYLQPQIPAVCKTGGVPRNADTLNSVPMVCILFFYLPQLLQGTGVLQRGLQICRLSTKQAESPEKISPDKKGKKEPLRGGKPSSPRVECHPWKKHGWYNFNSAARMVYRSIIVDPEPYFWVQNGTTVPVLWGQRPDRAGFPPQGVWLSVKRSSGPWWRKRF